MLILLTLCLTAASIVSSKTFEKRVATNSILTAAYQLNAALAYEICLVSSELVAAAAAIGIPNQQLISCASLNFFSPQVITTSFIQNTVTATAISILYKTSFSTLTTSLVIPKPTIAVSSVTGKLKMLIGQNQTEYWYTDSYDPNGFPTISTALNIRNFTISSANGSCSNVPTPFNLRTIDIPYFYPAGAIYLGIDFNGLLPTLPTTGVVLSLENIESASPFKLLGSEIETALWSFQQCSASPNLSLAWNTGTGEIDQLKLCVFGLNRKTYEHVS